MSLPLGSIWGMSQLLPDSGYMYLNKMRKNLKDFLQRVLTVTIDGYGDAQIATLQQLATEAFLRGCKFKGAATLATNEAPKSIQEACRRVKTVIANKKAVKATKVSFQELAFTF